MSNENGDESIVLDRDTSKPEPRLKKKVKKVVKKVKKTPKKQKESDEDEEDKSEELPPINNKDKVDKATSRQTSLMNNKKSEEEEEEEDEEPLKVKKSKETNEEEEESEEEKDNDDDKDKPNPLIEDANVKYLEQNLKKEYNDKETQCDIDKELVQNITNELTEEMNNKEKEHQKEIENIKSEYDKKQQSMIEEIEKLKNELNFEIKTKIETMKKLQDEIAIKDKNIQTLSNTNEKMRKNLTDLSNEVNSLFVQLTTTKKLLQSKEKNENEKKNMDEVIKAKDKEIKNSVALVQILSRDNRRLQGKLDNYAEYNLKVGLENTIKAKDAEIIKLNNEIKLLKKTKDPNEINTKNESRIDSLNKEISVLKNDIKVLKDENRTLKQKADQIMLESKEKPKKLISSSSAINIKTKKNLSLDKPKENQCNSSLTLATNSKCFYTLFNEEERNILMKYFNKRGGFDLFIKKITTLESYRSSNENRIKSSVKHLESLLASKEEQVEYLLLKNKENEMKLRISINNVNEGKNTIKVYQRKNNEQQALIDSLLSNLQAQESQIKYLNEQYLQMQKKEIQDITATKDTISIDLDKIIEKDKSTVEENKSKEIKKIENIVTYKEVPIEYKEIVVPTPEKEEKKTNEVVLPKIEKEEKKKEEIEKSERVNADQDNVEIEVVKNKKKTIKKKAVKKKKENDKDAIDVIQCEKHSMK